MARRRATLPWGLALQRTLGAFTRAHLRASTQAVRAAVKPTLERRKAPRGQGDWIAGLATIPGGMRRFQLYRPPGITFTEKLPLMVMLHGCGQDAKSFAVGTRMNALAAREGFFVLYPEQDRRANAHGCWNWFDTRSGGAQAEARIVLAAVQQVCLLYPIDRERVALAGLSAGASLAALLATQQPSRFKAVVMHSGVPPGMASSSATALAAMRGHRSAAAPEPGPPWPPLLVIHGANDRIVSSENAGAAARLWAEAAGARAAAPRKVQRGKRHAMTVTDYKLRGQTVASLCEVDALGHAWSGGAARSAYTDAQGPDASRLAWAFASRQFGKS